MQDPSQGIQRELQPHVHLLSTYRFPTVPTLHPDKVTEWLLTAPEVARSKAPFYWTYLDRPQDGTILLVWQSLSLGSDFPSDGYIWAPAEVAFEVPVTGGFTLQMYQHKAGYANGEQIATHARRRYRLTPNRSGNAPGPQPDAALWLIHYSPAEPQDRCPSSLIPIDIRATEIIRTRSYLQSQGQIVQKEFMLHDRTNWPQIAYPRGQARAPAMYSAHGPPARMPPAMAYAQQHTTPGPPAKRTKHAPTPNQASSNNAAAIHDVDDEEDTSRGDLFDHTTPREISMNRYKQNHEWMEEILSSPYAINQIIPTDLGLGVRGAMGSLTEGIFDAPFDPEKDVAKYSYVGRLEPSKADEFRKRAEDQIAQTNKDIEKMKRKHAKRLAKFQKGTLLSAAEKELRTAVDDPTDTGPEYWRLEGKIDDEDNEDIKAVPRVPSKVSDIVAQVEASVGRHAAAVKKLICIQKGGYEEPPAIPSPQVPAVAESRISPPGSHNGSNNGSQHSGVLVGDADLDMSNSAAGLLDQYHGLSSNATPASNFPTPQPHLQTHSSAGTPGNLNVHSPHPRPPGANYPAQGDTPMTDAEPGEQVASTDATGTGDWVVVPPGGVSPSTAQPPAMSVLASSSHMAVPTSSAPPTTNPSPMPVTTAGTSAANTPGMPDFHTSPNDFADLGDLDTAGEALASYGDIGNDGELDNLDMDMDVGMDDSAFGDAFHGVEPREGDEGTPGEGLL